MSRPSRSLFEGWARQFGGLFRSVGVYAGANMLNALVPFVLLPVFTRHMLPAEYGLLSLNQVIVAILTPFVGLSLQGAVGRRHVDRESINFPLYVTICLKIALVTWSVTAVIAMIAAPWVESTTGFPAVWLWGPLLIAGAQAVYQITLSIWQMEGRPLSYAFLQSGMLAGQFLLSYYLVVGKGMGWKGGVIGQASVAVVFAFVGLFFLWRERWLARGYDRSYVNHALRFGVPLIPHVLGAWVLTMVDRVFVVRYAGLAEAGVYAVGVQFGLGMSLLTTSFNQGWVPWLFARLRSQDKAVKIQVVKFTYAYCAVLLVLAVSAGLLAPRVVPLIVGDSYSGAFRYIPWIALAYAFNGMYKMVTNYIFFVEKTHILAWLTLSAGVVNVVASALLIKTFGAIGGAYAATISFFVSFVLTWWLASRVYPMPWKLTSERPK